MFTTEDESIFFLKHIDKSHKVLEWGSGTSTSKIAELCDKLVSIEHQKNWYDTIKNGLKQNVTLILKESNLPYIEGSFNCGNFDEFKDYIEAANDYGKFDVIFIDGRARVECAKYCEKICHEDTIIFIHDFTSRLQNHNYQEVFKYLDLIESVGDMSKFKIKK